MNTRGGEQMSKLRLALAGLGSIRRRHLRLLLERADVVAELVEPCVEAPEFRGYAGHPP